MGTPITKEEVEAHEKGNYDEDGFFILEDGGFYDPWGYYFNPNGEDEFGGYYNDQGYYIPGKDYEKDYYAGYYGVSKEDFDVDYQGYVDEEDEEEKEDPHTAVDADRDTQYEYEEHVFSAIKWLKEQAAAEPGKKYVIQIEGVSENTTNSSIVKFITEKIPQIKYDKI